MPADLRDIQVLGDLRTAFGKFGEEVQQIIPALQKQLDDIREDLQGRQSRWRRRTEEARDAVHAARRSLNRCENQPDDEDGNSPDCSSEQEDVSDAERALAEVEDNLETVTQWQHRIEGLLIAFESDIHRLSILASVRTISAQAVLANKLAILGRYVDSLSSNVGISGLLGQRGHDTIRPVADSIISGSRPPEVPVGLNTTSRNEKELFFCARIRNGHFAGKKHPVTGIPFDQFGFPNFESVAIKTVKIEFTGNRRIDRRAANKAAELNIEPIGYIWHHREDAKTLQLVPEATHRMTGHTGGAAGRDVLYLQIPPL